MDNVHSSARQGFGQEAATYTHGRPDYPEALLDWLHDSLGLGAGSPAVDLGAGTGKFTRLLLRSGAAVTAIEPVAAMRAQLAAELPSANVLDGTAQSLPLATDSVAALVCAQAFHWFASANALQEIHRVLRPGGRLGLVWNVRDESVDWVAELTRLIAPYEAGTPRFHTGQWREAFDGAPFGPLQGEVFEHLHVGPPAQVIVARTLSISFIVALPAAQKAEVERRLGELIERHPALRGQAQVAFPYRTEAYAAVALG